ESAMRSNALSKNALPDELRSITLLNAIRFSCSGLMGLIRRSCRSLPTFRSLQTGERRCCLGPARYSTLIRRTRRSQRPNWPAPRQATPGWYCSSRSESGMSDRTKIKVGVLGATGAVGQKFVKLLENHPWFELTE